MSKTVDEKVVSMKFDNSNFESNVKTTMSTLDKLKQSLNLKGASDGLNNVSKAAKNCDVSAIGTGIETVQAKFSALQIAGITIIQDLTRTAENFAKNIVKTFAIDPVTTGFQEYELKMSSVQTIMASTGASLSEVNGYLDELNLYADKTIYSFSDMTNSIGKFTNAGVSLDKAVLAIKGVSNEAAVSGANANEASRAMYNFAQALSAGYVKLIDWKSIENANMATVEFKQQLIESAVAAGTLTKTADGMYSTGKRNIDATHEFNDSLQDQWMTTDVLINTLSKYADETTDIGKKAYASAQDVKTFSMMMDTLKEAAQSGWSQTWEIIVGDFEEAKSLWTNLSNLFGGMIDKMSNARNTFLEKVLGGGSSDSWNKLANEVEKAGVSVEKFQNKLIKLGKKHGVVTDEMIKKAGSFEKSLESGWLSSDIVAEALNSFIKSGKNYSKSTEDMTAKLEKFQKVVNQVWNGDYKNGEARVKALTKAGYNYAEVQALVNKTVDGHKLTLADLNEKQLKSVGYTDKQIAALKKLKTQAEQTGTPLNKLIEDMSKPSGRTLLLESFSHILEQIGKVLDAVGKAWSAAFGKVDFAGFVYKAIKAFHDWAMSIEVTDTTLSNITDTIVGFLNAIKLIGIFSSGTIKFLNLWLTRILNILQLDFTGFTARLGRMITAFYNWVVTNNDVVQGIVKIGNQFLDYVEEMVSGIREWIAEFVKLPVVQENIERLKQAFIDTFGNLKEWINGFVPIFSKFVENLRSIKTLSFKDLKDAVVGFATNILKHFANLGSVFSDITAAIKKFIDDALSSFEGFNKGVTNIWTKIYTFLKGIKDKIQENFGFAEIFAVLTGGAIIVGAFKLLSIVEKLTKQLFKLSDGIAGVFGGLKSMFTSFGKAEEIRAKGEALRNIAIGVGVLAVSLYILSKIDTEKLPQAIALIVGIIASLALLAVGLGKLGALSISFKLGATAIAMIAGSMLLLALSLKILEDMDSEKAAYNAATLVGSMVILIGAVGVLSHFVPQLSTGSLIFISIGTALITMAKAMKMLSEINPDDAARSLDMITMLVLELMAFALIVNQSGAFAAKSGIAVLALSASLLIMIAAVKLISGLEPGEIAKGIIVMGLMGLLFAGIIAVTNVAGKYAARAGLTLLGFSVSLLIMVGVVKAINTLTEDEMKKAVDIIGYFAIVFSLLIAVTQLAGQYSARAGVMLITAAGAMLLLSAAMVVLSHVDPEGLKRAEIAIVIMGGIFAGLIAVASIANITGDTFKSLIAMVVAMGALVVAVAVLAMVPEENLLRATVAVTLVMGSLAAVMAATSKLAPLTVKTVGTLAAIMVVVGALTGIVYALSNFDSSDSIANASALAILMVSISAALFVMGKTATVSKSAMLAAVELSGIVAILAVILGTMSALDVTASIQSATALSILLLTMSACMVILSYTTPLADGAITAMYGLAGVVAILGLVLGVMAYFDVNPSIETATALSILLLSLSACCVILGTVGAVAPAALAGIGVLSVLIIAIGTLMAALGALTTYYPAMEDFLNKGLSMLELIGEGLGSFFGGIVSGFLNAATSDLGTVADNLSDFMNRLQPFLDGANSITEESVAGIDRLSKAILCISAAGFMDAITSFLTGGSSLASFGEQLAPFGKSIKEYGEAVSGLDSESITNSATAAENLSKLANSLPSQNGWAQSILGSKDLSTFGSSLKQFGTGLKDYAGEIAGLSVEDIVASIPAGQALSDLANSLPTKDGLAQCILGSQSLGNFGDTLKRFGTGLKNYAAEIAGISIETIVASVPAGQALSDLANSLPTKDGWAQTIFGGKSLGNFGDTLKRFGTGLKDYAGEVAGLQVESIVNSVEAGRALSNLANVLPDTNSWGETIFGGGKESLATFGSNLSSFGGSLQTFSKYEIDASKIYAATNASKKLAELEIPEDTSKLSFFGSSIKTFGEKIAAFNRKIADVDPSKFSSVISSTKQLVSLINSLGNLDASGISKFKQAVSDLSSVDISSMVKAFESAKTNGISAIQSMMSGMNSAVTSGSSQLASAFKNIMSTAINGIKSMSSSFMSVGKYLCSCLSKGIQSGSSGATAAVKSILSSCKTAGSDAKTDFHSLGASVVEGFANGISDNTFIAEAKAAAMAEKAKEAAKKKLDINSPSKVFRKIGKSVPEGFAQGIGMMDNVVTKSVESMADNALDGTKKALSRLSDAVNSNIDSQPTIRPVLDLSDVQSGANAIVDLLGYNQTMAFATNVGSMMNQRIQNGTTNDVVSAIDKLNKSLNNLERPSYNINGITYDDGSNITNAVQDLVRAARIERRV